MQLPSLHANHLPTQRNHVRWGGGGYLWHQMMAQKGYVVFFCDCRTASGKGAQSTWPLHRNFGELEMRDIEDAMQWLADTHAFVDKERMGIWG